MQNLIIFLIWRYTNVKLSLPCIFSLIWKVQVLYLSTQVANPSSVDADKVVRENHQIEKTSSHFLRKNQLKLFYTLSDGWLRCDRIDWSIVLVSDLRLILFLLEFFTLYVLYFFFCCKIIVFFITLHWPFSKNGSFF